MKYGQLMKLKKTFFRIGVISVLSTALFACSSTDPIAQTEDADVKEIVWEKCVGKDAPDTPFECGSVDAPIDFRQPEGDKTSIALVRLPAADSKTREGVILTNPGGPGASGFDFVVSTGKLLASDLGLDEFDIVGFDPRGVDRSGGVRCSTDAEMDKFSYLDWTPDNKAEQALFDENEKDTSTCEDKLGKSIKFYSTEYIARDMDLIRAGMRVEKIHYLGISYGTYLGGVYATLFPDRVASMVLNAAFDPQGDTVEEENTTQAIGFEKAFANWVTWCEKDSTCDFQDEDVAAKWGTLYDRLDKTPLRTSKNREVNHEVLMTATISMLYVRWWWVDLGSALEQAQKGNPDSLLDMADSYNGRQEDGTYSTSQDSFYLIRCASGFEKELPKDPESLVKKLKEVAPWFSQGIDISSFDEPGCEDIFNGIEMIDISYKGKAPILVVGGENDPATPFRWSQEMLLNMGSNASLVKFTGEGHSQILESKCVDALASETFKRLKVPTAQTTCNPDKPVPRPSWWSNIPTGAKPGVLLDSKVMNPLLNLKETDAFAEFRAIPGNVDAVFSKIYREFDAAQYGTDCKSQSAPTGTCYFLKDEIQQIGVVVYTAKDIRDWEISAPNGPVPSGMNLFVFYYWP